MGLILAWGADVPRPVDPIRVETWAIGMRKGEAALKAGVNEWLKGFRAAGKFDELAETYMADEKKVFDEQEVPFIFH